ncbi:MAG: hypothetical protein BWY46_01420 [Firmicutes bacterium ADurb.Bin300]|nr:MAG: hypothetical protein BWY46_01420 [Firmicutes bacterium ADurb.Bin300]
MNKTKIEWADRDNKGRFISEGAKGNKYAVKHGQSYTKLYSVWHHIKGRCYGNDSQHKKYYSLRGITMCEEWKNDFVKFQKWALSNGYKEGLTIDRIDVNGNYSPNNCRWATPREQSNNKRNTLFITYNGVTHSVSEWSEIMGLPYHVVFKRHRKGWSAKRTLTTPLVTSKSHHAKQCEFSNVPIFMKDSLMPITGEENMLREFPQGLTKEADNG